MSQTFYLILPNAFKLSLVPGSIEGDGGITDMPTLTNDPYKKADGFTQWTFVQNTRNGTNEGVSANFVSKSGGKESVFSMYSTNYPPTNCYFYFECVMTLSVEVDNRAYMSATSNLYIAQAHDDTRFPWWIGGENIKRNSDIGGTLTYNNTLTCNNISALNYITQSSANTDNPAYTMWILPGSTTTR